MHIIHPSVALIIKIAATQYGKVHIRKRNQKYGVIKHSKVRDGSISIYEKNSLLLLTTNNNYLEHKKKALNYKNLNRLFEIQYTIKLIIFPIVLNSKHY